MDTGKQRGSDAEAASDPRVSAAYEVVISQRRPERLADWQLLGALEEVREQVAEELARRAIRRFGPGYSVEVTEGRTGGSVHTTVLLAVRYSVRAVAGAVDEFRRFAGEVEIVFAEALSEPTRDGVEVVAEADPAVLIEPAAAAEEGSSWDRTAPILGAVATGVGVLGLVTFVGGAIDWARFHATGLPKEQALGVVPTSDLVVVGARTLAPAVLWGLLACALYAVGASLAGSRQQRAGARTTVEPAEHAGTARAVFLALMVLGFEILVFFITLEKPGTRQFLVFLPLALLLAMLTYAVAKVTERFVYLSFAVFLALSVFLAGIAYARALDTPELRGAAIVRDNQKAVIGFFVAENGSRVYLARLEGERLENEEIDRSSARLIGIDKTEISSIEVGAPTAPAAALEQAKTLAEELCELEVPRVPNPKLAAKDQHCWTRPPGVYEVSSPPKPSSGRSRPAESRSSPRRSG